MVERPALIKKIDGRSKQADARPPIHGNPEPFILRKRTHEVTQPFEGVVTIDLVGRPFGQPASPVEDFVKDGTSGSGDKPFGAVR